MNKQKLRQGVIWNYIGTVFIYGINLFLLPFVLSYLAPNELGLWYTFASVSTVIQLVNFGFSPCIMRNVGHVWGGVQRIEAHGIDSKVDVGERNYDLLNDVIRVSREIYQVVALIILALALLPGNIYIHSILEDIDSIYGLGSWSLYGLGIAVNMQFNYWDAVLRGIGGIAEGQKANIASKIAQLIISFVGLLLGLGLWALAVANFASGLVLRLFAKRYCVKLIGKDHFLITGRCKERELKRAIISNAARFGTTALAGQMVAQAYQMIVASNYGLSTSAKYGLTVQLLGVITTVSCAYFNAILPEINIQRASGNLNYQKELLSVGTTVQWAISACGIATLLLLGPPVLKIVSEEHALLPFNQMLLLSLVYFIETNRLTFTTYISTSNTLPYTKSVLISSCITTAAALFLTSAFSFPLIAIIAIRLLVEVSYNGWKWMYSVLIELNTTPLQMIEVTWHKIHGGVAR